MAKGILGIAADKKRRPNYINLDFTQGVMPWQFEGGFSRGSTGYYHNSSGVLTQAANNVPRFDYQYITNLIRNSTMVGATSSVPPTYWNVTQTVAGISMNIVDAGTEYGKNYVDIRVNGTASSANTISLGFEDTTIIPAINGTVFNMSGYYRLIAGSGATFSTIQQVLHQRDGSGVHISTVTTGTDRKAGILSTLRRFSDTITVSSSSTVYVRPALYFNFANGAVLDITIRVYAPQLEYGNTTHNWIATSGSSASEWQPRGLLQESGSTNMAPRSQELDNTGSWSLVGSASITANSTVAPDGTTTADTYVEAGSTSAITKLGTQTITTGQYCFSGYFKRTNSDWIMLTISSNNTPARGIRGWFNIANGYVGGTAVVGTGWFTTSQTLTITNCGNGWYRCSISTSNTSDTSIGYQFQTASANLATTRNDIGSGEGVGSSVIGWGMQLESRSYPTSYIPTVGSSVTRSRDVLYLLNLNNIHYNYSEGTLVFAFETMFISTDTAAKGILSIDNSTGSDRHILYKTASSSSVRVEMENGGNNQMRNTTATSFNQLGLNKAGYGYKLNDSMGCLNAGTAVTDATCTPSPITQGIDRIRMGETTGGTTSFMWLKGLLYYPRKLQNTEIQALTSLGYPTYA